MMASATIVTQAKKVLAEVHEFFGVEGHWIQGDFQGDDEDEPLDTFCAIGGLRHKFGYYAEENVETLADDDAYKWSLLTLVTQIAQTAHGDHAFAAKEALEQQNRLWDDDIDEEAVEAFEMVVINWNDAEERALREILYAFGRAAEV